MLLVQCVQNTALVFDSLAGKKKKKKKGKIDKKKLTGKNEAAESPAESVHHGARAIEGRRRRKGSWFCLKYNMM